MCHVRLMHCGKPWNLYILITLITSPLQTTYPKKLLHLEFQSNNFLLALTETNKQTFEMTGCKSESVISDAVKHILECLQWLWNCGRSAFFSFKINNDF